MMKGNAKDVCKREEQYARKMRQGKQYQPDEPKKEEYGTKNLENIEPRVTIKGLREISREEQQMQGLEEGKNRTFSRTGRGLRMAGAQRITTDMATGKIHTALHIIIWNWGLFSVKLEATGNS